MRKLTESKFFVNVELNVIKMVGCSAVDCSNLWIIKYSSFTKIDRIM